MAPSTYTSLPDELLLPDEPPDPEKPDIPQTTRLRDGHSGRAILSRLLMNDRRPSLRRRLTEAMIRGAKPFPEDGSGQTNLNFLDGKAIMAQSGVPYYAIFNGVSNYAQIECSFQPENADHARWGDAISLRFHELLSRWNPEFDWHMQQASYQMRLHGIGPCYFDKPNDWRFRSLEAGSVLVEPGSASCVDARLPEIVVRIPYRAHELFDFINGQPANETGFTATGWNVQAVRQAIQSACRGQSWAQAQGVLCSWDVFEREFTNNGLAISTAVGFIFCAHLLVREFDGKVSRFVITEGEMPAEQGGPPTPDKDVQFLYRSLRCYDNYRDALVVFFKDIGDGAWHSVKGYASDAFDTLVVGNQMLCQAIDAARVDASILLEFPTTPQRDKMDKFRITRGIIKLPVGCKVTQARMQGSMQGVVVIEQLLRTKLSNNLGNFQGRGMSREDGKGETVTAKEVEARVAKEASLNEGEQTLFFGHLDSVYQRIYAIVSDPSTTDEESKRFQEDCFNDGVPKEALKNPKSVRANRESGYGSPAMRDLKLQKLRELAPSLPTEGQQNLLDMEISATAGPDKVKLLNPRQHVPDINDAFAAMENAMIAEGRQPVLISGMDDIIHMHSHLGDAANTLEPLKKQMDQGQSDPEALQKAFQYCQIMAAHCQDHLRRMFKDPTKIALAKDFQDKLAHIVAFSGKLRGAIISAQKARQLALEDKNQATALSELDQAKVDHVQTSTQLAAMKTAASIRDKNLKTTADLTLKQIQTAASIHTDRMKALQAPKQKAA